MNRTNSFVSALKWWPSLGGNSSSSGSGNTSPVAAPKTAFGSSIAVQKLRESKWFGPTADEQRIFCAVVEAGFIVEVRPIEVNGCNIEPWFGIVICKSAKDKKPSPETIEIFTIKVKEYGHKIVRYTLTDICKNDWKIRINNFSDKEKPPHNDKDIKNQISFARKTRVSLWHNSQHFAYWCRYGSRQQDIRRRQMSECVKWGTVGMNAGMLLIMNQNGNGRQKSHSK